MEALKSTNPSAAVPVSGLRAYFSVHKKGQGFWVRVGTWVAAVLVILLTANFINQQLRSLLDFDARDARLLYWSLGMSGLFIVVSVAIVHWITNRPSVVDFLILTEEEMNKVNWTSREELIGSTKVVILFMAIIATGLFLTDLIFHSFFYAIRVLEFPPPFLGGLLKWVR